MKELRRQSREIINFYLQVMDQEQDQLLGYLLDVNEIGLLLQSHEALEDSGKVYHLRLLLRDSLKGHDQVDIKARVVWSRKPPGSVFHHSGFEFVDISEESLTVIQALMERFGIDCAVTD